MRKLVVLALTVALLCEYIYAGWGLGSIGRRWYAVGNFSVALNTENDPVEASNIAGWNGEEWNPLGEGTNGKINTVRVDDCRTVIVGGSFDTAGGVPTGPVAKWSPFTSTWEKIFLDDNPIAPGGEIYAISYDCFNFNPKTPSEWTKCQCDIYIGGKFTITVDGVTAYNLAKWDAIDKKWDLLAADDAGRPGQNDYVYTMWKKSISTSESHYFLWVGGSFTGLRKYNRNSKVWDASPQTPAGGNQIVTGNVNSLYYYIQELGKTDEIYVGGSIWVKDNTGATVCRYICVYDYKQNQFYVVGKDQQPNSAVNAMGFGGSKLYIASGDAPYIRSITHAKMGMPDNNWHTINAIERVNEEIVSLDVCGNDDVGCPSVGSLAMVLKSGKLTFFNSEKSTFDIFGGGVNGKAFSIKSALTADAPALVAKFALTLACIAFALVFAF